MVGSANPLKCFVPWKDCGFRASQGNESASIKGGQEETEFVQLRAVTFARLTKNHDNAQNNNNNNHKDTNHNSHGSNYNRSCTSVCGRPFVYLVFCWIFFIG